MAHYNFHDDLQDGQRAEQEVIDLLLRHFPEITDIEQSAGRGYDIRGMYRGRSVTFEVKYDIAVERTGNVAIEYESRGKATGIAITEADYWVYKFLGEFFVYRTVSLKKKIFEEKAYDRKASGGDPGSNTRMFLVEAGKFRGWGKELVPKQPGA